MLPAERTGDPLKSSVSLGKSLKMFFQSHLLLSLHMHLYFFIPACVKGCRCYYRFILFCYRRCLPFSVQAGLQIFTYLCEFFVLFAGFIFSTALFEAISLSFDACLVFVTCVLALCRDGFKQMSDLPFFFLIEEYIVTHRADDPKFNFQCTGHLQGRDCEYYAGKAQLSARDPPAAVYVTIPTVMRAE